MATHYTLQHQVQKLKLFIFYVLIFISIDAIARAGGGGGGKNSGGGSIEGIGEIIYFIIRILPFPYNIIVIGILVVLFFWYARNNKQSSPYNSLSNINTKYSSSDSIDVATKQITNFNETEFKEKAKTAFLKIQEAWQAQNLKDVRRFISDGVYQRFEAQFIMMRALEQTNEVSDVNIEDLKINYVENDGKFNIVHVAITAVMTDYFKSKKYSQLNSGGKETFTEYWTFVKKINTAVPTTTNMFATENCPNCGDSTHDKLGEISKCSSCGSIINGGDYDWVLSEITQAEEYAINYNQLPERSNLYARIKNKGLASIEFSPQYIEDKASNAYLQLKIAFALANKKRVARFCSTKFDEESKELYNNSYLYNRLFLKDVSLVNIFNDEQSFYAAISVTAATQKVTLTNNKLDIINTVPIANIEYLILSRSRKISANKHSALAHNCSSCGAPIQDSLKLTCEYCDAQLNDNAKDWIVEHLFNEQAYLNFKDNFSSGLNTKKQEEKLDDLSLEVRDYALNNMMVVANADGIIQDEERIFLIDTAKAMGYNSKKIIELFNQIKPGGLSLKMPQDEKQRAKVLKLMTKIANADGDFNEKEKAILAEAEKMIGL